MKTTRPSHVVPCPVCGTKFEQRISDKQPRSCSRACGQKLRERVSSVNARGERRVWIDGSCLICGAAIKQRPDGRPLTCSTEHGHELRGRRRAEAFERDRASGKLKCREIDPNGYVRIRLSPLERESFSCYEHGWTLEHRYLVEQKLGRRLESHETVHHVNADRSDNRPENLELRVGRHGFGATGKHCPSCTCFDH